MANLATSALTANLVQSSLNWKDGSDALSSDPWPRQSRRRRQEDPQAGRLPERPAR